MFKERKMFLLVLAGVLAFGSAVKAFGVGASSNHRNAEPTLANSSHARTRTRNHRRHRSPVRSKRVPKAKSLEKESW